MRRIFTFFAVYILSFGCLWAQGFPMDRSHEESQENNHFYPQNRTKEVPQDGGWEAIKAQKVAFLTQQIDLTSQEAQKFWPIYNEWEKQWGALNGKREGLEAQMRRTLRSDKPNVNPFLEPYMQTFQEEQALRSMYHYKYCSILSPEKVAKLYIAEKRFQNQMLRDWMEQHITEKSKGNGRK